MADRPGWRTLTNQATMRSEETHGTDWKTHVTGQMKQYFSQKCTHQWCS